MCYSLNTGEMVTILRRILQFNVSCQGRCEHQHLGISVFLWWTLKLRLFYCWKNVCCLFGSLFLRHFLQERCKRLNMAISSGCHCLMQIFSIKARFIVQSLMSNVHKICRNSSEPYMKYNKIPGCNNFATTNVTESR